MKMLIFSVFDAAVNAYLQPFFVRSKGEAIRSFQDAVNDPKSQFNIHYTDYSLFLLGSYDDASGVFDTNIPERVTGARDVIVEDGASASTTWEPDRPVKIGQR
ncbi:nonstructural protein [Blackfly microvirus SF02]|uniref:Nonstructural protein n=1 Tax=Blackfly microvirus SF02 TaxID=2576452 RepID=A0A4P8PKD4_9VIRU|nr:nonstructural protein [Blackfly microvirus SF02]